MRPNFASDNQNLGRERGNVYHSVSLSIQSENGNLQTKCINIRGTEIHQKERAHSTVIFVVGTVGRVE